MKRRDAFLALASTAACAIPAPAADAPTSSDLSEAQVEALLRSVAKVEPRPGEAERIRQALAAPGVSTESDPRVQPALAFDPEVEP